MGIFNRSNQKNTEVREAPQQTSQESYTVPVGLEFLIPYLGKGEATAISAFFGGLQLISSTMASIPIHVRRYSDGEIIDHPFDLAMVSGLLSKFTLVKQLIWDLYIYGNAIAYIERAQDGSPKKLIYCPNGSYSIVYNDMNHSLYYLLNNITKKKVEPVNVIHLVLNSKDGINGKGIPLFAQKIIQTALATDTHAKNYFENGANIDGILKSNRPLSSAQKLDIKQSWQAIHGAGKAGGIAIVGNDMDYIAVGSKGNEAQMIESRKFNAEEVCRYLNIDPILLGVSGATSYNSLEQAQLSFLSHCIYPLISLVEAEFNRKMLKPSELSRIYIDFDENHIMFSDKAATANYYSTLVSNGILSINEARHNLGYNPKEGGDDLIIPYTDIADNTIGAEKNEEDKDGNNQKTS